MATGSLSISFVYSTLNFKPMCIVWGFQTPSPHTKSRGYLSPNTVISFCQWVCPKHTGPGGWPANRSYVILFIRYFYELSVLNLIQIFSEKYIKLFCEWILSKFNQKYHNKDNQISDQVELFWIYICIWILFPMLNSNIYINNI